MGKRYLSNSFSKEESRTENQSKQPSKGGLGDTDEF